MNVYARLQSIEIGEEAYDSVRAERAALVDHFIMVADKDSYDPKEKRSGDGKWTKGGKGGKAKERPEKVDPKVIQDAFRKIIHTPANRERWKKIQALRKNDNRSEAEDAELKKLEAARIKDRAAAMETVRKNITIAKPVAPPQSSETYERDPDKWTTTHHAVTAIKAKHGVDVIPQNGMSDDKFLRCARLTDHTFDYLKKNFPGVLAADGKLGVPIASQALYGKVDSTEPQGMCALRNGLHVVDVIKNGILSTTSGLYQPGQEKMFIRSDLPWDFKSHATGLEHGGGKFSISGGGFSGVLRHELGHAIEWEYNRMFKTGTSGLTHRRAIYDECKAKYGFVSKYAMTNACENFAESFCAYTDPGYATSPHKIHPELEKAFDRLLKGKTND